MIQCDRCGPSTYAYVVVARDDLELHFCYHHFNTFEASLIGQGFAILVDRRSDLFPQKELVTK